MIVTSEFHMARVEAIFRWIFSVEPAEAYDLTFEAAGNTGISADALSARRAKEHASLAGILEAAAAIRTMADLHHWLYTRHAAYAWYLRGQAYRTLVGEIAKTY